MFDGIRLVEDGRRQAFAIQIVAERRKDQPLIFQGFHLLSISKSTGKRVAKLGHRDRGWNHQQIGLRWASLSSPV